MKILWHSVKQKNLRKKILLANHNACCYCGDLTTELPIAQSTISQHLKVLKDVGLIDGEIAPPKVCYRINRENLLLAKKLFSELL